MVMMNVFLWLKINTTTSIMMQNNSVVMRIYRGNSHHMALGMALLKSKSAMTTALHGKITGYIHLTMTTT